MPSPEFVIVGVGILVVALIVAASGIPSFRSGRITRQVQGRLLIAIGLGVVAVFALSALVGLVVWLTDTFWGVTLMAGVPGLATALAVSVFALPWHPVAADAVREARLEVRSVRALIPRRRLIVSVVLVASLVLLLTATGLTAQTNFEGEWSSAYVVGPTPQGYLELTGYPGWRFGIPILLSIAAVLVAGSLAMRRIAAAPQVSIVATRDLEWRQTAVGVVLLIVDLAVLGALAFAIGLLAPLFEMLEFGEQAGGWGSVATLVLGWGALLVIPVVLASLGVAVVRAARVGAKVRADETVAA